jgi:hypothetical protein
MGGHSGRATGPFQRVVACAAGRAQAGTGVVKSVI